MSATTSDRITQDGFEVLVLRNTYLELAVVPALGGKVISLRNLHSGREWLWHPATGLKLFRNQPGEDFSRSTLVGWDECLPTITPCVWKGRSLPDHGEAWSLPWEADPHALARGELQTSVHLPVSSLHLTRTLSLKGSVLSADYVLENPTSQPQEFLWAAHPLLAMHKGDQLELTDETRHLLGGHSCLDTLDFADGSPRCAKLYAGPLRRGSAGVFNPRTRDRLTFEWDTAECDTLGIWLTCGGWHGHHHLAFEPTNGSDDSLAVAATDRKHCGTVPARGRKAWHIQIRLAP